jgi:hypothetical protein
MRTGSLYTLLGAVLLLGLWFFHLAYLNTSPTQILSKKEPQDTLNDAENTDFEKVFSEIPQSLFSNTDPSILKSRLQSFMNQQAIQIKSNYESHYKQLMHTQMKTFLENFKKEQKQSWFKGNVKLPQTSRKWLELAKELKEYNQQLSELENNFQLSHETKLFPDSLSKVMREMKETRVAGFEFCSIFDHSTMNPWIHICTFFYYVLIFFLE